MRKPSLNSFKITSPSLIYFSGIPIVNDNATAAVDSEYEFQSLEA